MVDKMPSIFVSVFTVSVVFAHLCAGHHYRVCEFNSELRPCGSVCEPTCENPDPRFCTPVDKESCEDECRCLEGFVRNQETGQCCSIEHCPRRKRREECMAHEHLTLCGRNCEPTCSNPNPDTKSCSRMRCTRHTSACRCVDGRVRNQLTGECCRLEDCPVLEPEPQCSANEHFALCGRYCEPTCKNPNLDSESCSRMECTNQTEACRCKDGRVRNTLTGECCRVEDCPVIKPQCPANEHLALCGRNCEPTCKNPDTTSLSCPKEKCTNQTESCRCKDGRVRNTLTGECCRVEDCPVIKPQCPANEHLALCGRNCEPTCKNPDTTSLSCPKEKCTNQTEACRCKDGRVRNTLTGECCRVEDCPVIKPQCPANEHLALCGRNCEPTCKNPDTTSLSCPKEKCTNQTEACRCKDGRVRNTLTGECCRVEDCPVIKPQCPANEHLALCGRNCEPTCKNPDTTSMSCPKEKCTNQTEACRCKDGRVRNTLTGECCRVEDCPVIKPQCPANEHLALCGRNCEPTCKNPDTTSLSCPKEKCTNQTEACRCKDGRVRNTLTGECCRVEDCPVIKPQCPANEHLALCGRNCEPTCKNPNTTSLSCPKEKCTNQTESCRCKDGRVRNTLTGECCRVEDCPVIKPQCPANEHLALCGRNCEPTCKNPDTTSMSCPKEKCTNQTEACRCKDGRVRNTLTGECCRVEDCPVIKPQCPANEHLALCGRNCEPTCKNPDTTSLSCPKEKCTNQTEACRCKDGRVRNTLTGECCKVEDCPVIKPQCPANEHLALCGRNCEPTCKNPDTTSMSCPKEKCTNQTEACRCKDGRVRNTLTGECCRVEDCPVIKPQCPANEHLALCGRNCEPTCKNPNTTSLSCPKEKCTNQTEACRCKDGRVRNTLTGECCRVEDCPVIKPQCPANEHLALCGRNCEPTCKNPDTTSLSCPKEKCTNQTEACRCKDGRVRNTLTGECCKVEDCPVIKPQCPANEHLALCGRNCEPTCKNPNTTSLSCPKEKCTNQTEACRCKDGRVRNTLTGECCKVEDCPVIKPQCPANEHLALCGRNCEPTCKNPNTTSLSCPKEKCTNQTEACRCKDGRVRNTLTGECCRVEDCPVIKPQCPANEHLALCGRNCEPTCKNPDTTSLSCPKEKCTNQTEACRCKDGRVRNTLTGECCKVEDCPVIKPQCPANEHLALCGRNCEPTCKNPDTTSMSCPKEKCTNQTEACRCKDGRVRNTLTGECCRVEDCPVIKPQCPANEHLALCGRNCEPTCKNPNTTSLSCPKEKCTNQTEACRCKDGRVRNTLTGECCRVEDCPVIKPQCPANEHLALCGRNCEPTCKNPDTTSLSCPKEKCTNQTEACRCKDGRVRNTLTGECCKVEDCPVIKPQCPANEHLALCGRNCEPTCKNPNTTSLSCPKEKCTNQTEACRCKDGRVRNTLTGECCKVEDCPVIKPQCPANEHLALCGRNCEPTCKNPNTTSLSCPKEKCTNQTEACRCKDGRVRNTLTGECCRVEDCPVIKPQCPANEHLALCGRNCEPTCKNPDTTSLSCPKEKCTNQTEACRCKDGRVRNTLTGECCRVEDCPVIKPQCPANEHLALCGRNCEPTCKNPNTTSLSCPKEKCTNQTEACRCKDGRVRNTLTGECCKVEDCPVIKPQCPANEHLALCGRNCEPTCKNPNTTSLSCPKEKCTNQTEACRCKDGRVRNTLTGECCRVEDCPVIKPQCPANERLALCGRNCEPTCKNPKPDSISCSSKECTNQTEACQCIDGYVRNTLSGECCRAEQCPTVQPLPQCPANERFALCGRNCEPTCKSINVDSKSCPITDCTEHTQACRCTEGHVRNILTGECCKVEDCPVVKPLPKCSANEHFALCGRHCEPTCEHRNAEQMPCHTKECNKHTEGCRCMDGHVRNIETGECVKIDECPKPPQKCPINEVFVLCGRNNEPTCENQKPDFKSCTSKECTKDTQACRCVNGLVRNLKTGKCVRVDDCPKSPPKCTIANEHFALCGRNCEPTCEHQKPELMSCHTKKCNEHTEGCRCMDGYVRNIETGECVKTDDCPKPPLKCAANEHLTLCGRTCEPCCKDPNRNATSCPTIECNKHTEGCRCIDGHVRNFQTGECVKVNDCPKPQKCSPNEYFALCGRHCEPNCRNPYRNSLSCPKISCAQSTQACRCLDGYVRNRKTGQCVRVDDCPVIRHHGCPDNEHLALCGRNCEPNCRNSKPNSMSCLRMECSEHTQACRCNKGYVRDSITMKCVLHEECAVCHRNEQIGRCGKICEATCNNRDVSRCAATRCAGYGCQCKPGFFRNEETNMCVRVGRCPQECGVGEIFAPCGSLCEATCTSPSLPEMCKSMKCPTRGCRCNLDAGFVLDEDTGRCIQKEKCSCKN